VCLWTMTFEGNDL